MEVVVAGAASFLKSPETLCILGDLSNELVKKVSIFLEF